MVTFLERQRLRAEGLALLLSRGARRFLPLPRLVQIEITNRCNLFCRTCTRLEIPTMGDMPYEHFTRIIDSLGDVRTLWLSGQGEPLLHPDLARMVRYCRTRGITGTVVHTNATLLEGERLEALANSGLGELRVSIDGGSAEDVEYLRAGLEMDVLLRNTAEFVRRSRTPVAFYAVLNRKNYRSVHLLPELAMAAGVRRLYAVETVPFRDASQEREVFDRREYQFTSLPASEQAETLQRLREAGRRHHVRVRVDLKWYRTRCLEPSRKLYLDVRGNATPCCRIHHEVLVGNVLESGVPAVWYGETLERWRRALRRPKEHPRLCVERCNLGIDPKH